MKIQFVALAAVAVLGIVGSGRSVCAQTVSGARGKTLTPSEQEQWSQAIGMRNSALHAIDLGDYARAEADARKAITLGDQLTDEVLAQALYRQGKYDEAFPVYQKFVKVNWGYPRNELPFALLLLKRGEWEQAVEYYNGSLHRLGEGNLLRANSHFTPDAYKPRELETAIHVAMGLNFNTECSMADGSDQDDKAVKEFQAALAIDSHSALANYYYGKGILQLAKEHKMLPDRRKQALDEARAAFQQAASLGWGDVKDAAEKSLREMPNSQAGTLPRTENIATKSGMKSVRS